MTQGTQPSALYQPSGVGGGGRRERSSGGGEHMHSCGWFTLLYDGNQHNIVNQLSPNKKHKIQHQSSQNDYSWGAKRILNCAFSPWIIKVLLLWVDLASLLGVREGAVWRYFYCLVSTNYNVSKGSSTIHRTNDLCLNCLHNTDTMW